jgi:hypothetical protein
MQPYKLSFTAASLMLVESVKVAGVYLGNRDWNASREILINNNLLRSRTMSRTKRIIQELVLRLSVLSEDQLTGLVEGSLEEQRLLLWFMVCKTYNFIRDFSTEVLHERFLTMQRFLTEEDYFAFYLHKLDEHPELEEITDSTRTKLRTQVFRMLREAGLINSANLIIRVLPTSRLIQTLREDMNIASRIYPAFPKDFEV